MKKYFTKNYENIQEKPDPRSRVIEVDFKPEDFIKIKVRQEINKQKWNDLESRQEPETIEQERDFETGEDLDHINTPYELVKVEGLGEVSQDDANEYYAAQDEAEAETRAHLEAVRKKRNLEANRKFKRKPGQGGKAAKGEEDDHDDDEN